MTGNGHRLTGIGAAGLAAFFAPYFGHNPLIACALAIPGATAPDWLEIPIGKGGGHTRLIKHRTITHVVLFWLVALGISASNQTLWANALFGFCFGGLMHLLVDIPNPMGVPLWHPYRRYSLKLWRSGQREMLIILITWAIPLTLFWWRDGDLFEIIREKYLLVLSYML